MDASFETRRTGGCFCHTVRYEAVLATDAILHCHCENCRRLSGNYVAAVRSFTSDLSFTADSGLAWVDVDGAKYGICSECGSLLFFDAEDQPDTMSLMVGTLDDASGLRVESVWFADEAQPHHQLPDVPHHAGNG